MFDMGPYYLTALVFLLGQPKRLFGMATVSGPERAVGEEQMSSHSLAVNTPDHVAGTIEFEGGATGAIMTSFCAWHSPHSTFTIFGTEGTLEVPDPNRYDGRARVAPKRGHGHWEDVVCPENTNYARGLGLADMAWAIRTGVPHRASGHLAFSILDMIEGFFDSRASGIAHTPVPCGRPEAAPLGWMDG
jgi:predicted dehydrogenase